MKLLWRFGAFKRVFSKIKYIILTLIVAVISFIGLMWFPNLHFISQIISSHFLLSDKILLLLELLGSIGTNFTFLSAALTIAVIVLFSINISIFVYLFSHQISMRRRKEKNFLMILAGTVAGMLGIGCAACGSLFVSVFLPFVAGTTLAAFLPLHGEEFSILSLILLYFSLVYSTRSIEDPSVCL